MYEGMRVTVHVQSVRILNDGVKMLRAKKSRESEHGQPISVVQH